MAGTKSDLYQPDGSLDWSGGVDSLRVPTIQSTLNPNGLARNQVAWLNNATVRGQGITPRTGWKYRGTIADHTGYYQGGAFYTPTSANPYFVIGISGSLFKVDPDFATAPVNLSGATLKHPAAQPRFNFCQAEEFLIIQAGDLTTLPLFYDGVSLRRSKGITNVGVSPGTPGVNEIPAATCMDYYQGRLWYAQGRTYSAGDIVGGDSGTSPYSHRDSVLNVTENPLVLGGDGFTVPDASGNIRALFHNANINTTLGQGQLLIGTRRAVYALDVPVSRSDWIATDSANQPKQTIVQLTNGPVNDWGIVRVNGDVFYPSLEPSIRSLFAAVRNFSQWANPPIASEETRILSFFDRGSMQYMSGILWDDRLLFTALPTVLPQGVVHPAIIPLDFMPINSLSRSTATPVWEGMYEGLQILQLFVGDFNGMERAFAAVVSTEDSSIQLWELTNYERSDWNKHGELRSTWVIEFPAFTWGDEMRLKRLVSAELWLDKIYGEVHFQMDYRSDQDPCWKLWKVWKTCQARNSAEDVMNPIPYPLTTYREGYRSNYTLPVPPEVGEPVTGRPACVGYQFQPRLTIKGWCRVRGLYLYANFLERALYEGSVCS